MKNLSDLLRDFRQAKKQQQQLIDTLPRIIGVESVKIIKQNFALQGYDSGNGIIRWAPRKAATNAAYDRGKIANPKTGKLSKYRKGKSSYKGSVFSSANPLLMQTLNLYNAIDYRVAGKRIFVGSNLTLIPYAKAHNEGLNNEPRRQYMPVNAPNAKMTKHLKKIIDEKTASAMKMFKK